MTAASTSSSTAPDDVFAIQHAEADSLQAGQVEVGLHPHYSPLAMA